MYKNLFLSKRYVKLLLFNYYVYNCVLIINCGQYKQSNSCDRISSATHESWTAYQVVEYTGAHMDPTKLNYQDLTTNRICRVQRAMGIFLRKPSPPHDFRPKLGTTTIQLSQSVRIKEYQQCRLWIHLWFISVSEDDHQSIRNSTISRGFGRQTINRATSQELWISQNKTTLWNNNREYQEHQDLQIHVRNIRIPACQDRNRILIFLDQ